MSYFKSELITFRIKPNEKALLLNLAEKEQLHLSEFIRELIKKRLKREKQFN